MFGSFIGMKKFVIENKNLVILWVLCGIALFIFCGHYGNILLDIGREIYYPQRILEGKILYKNLFNIYGPMSYLLNAFLYKIFSPNLAVLYFSGILCSFGIVTGIYLIAKKFLSEFLSLSLGIFTVITGVCATHLFSFTFPYSWAMLYGTVGFIYSVWALIKYKTENKLPYLYLSSLLAGFCVCNKYDFYIYALLLLVIVLFTKNKRAILSCFTCFLIFPAICGLTLFVQGLRLNDLFAAVKDIKDVVYAPTLHYFYTIQGIYFHKKILNLWLINILKTGFGKDLFYDWRYNTDGSLNEAFELNKPEHKGASILITGNDFGSGSSREHAVWALTDYGFRAVIGGGFSDIFYMNSTKNGLLPIVLPEENRKILRGIQADETIQIDLPEQTVTYKNNIFHFDINSQWKEKFINGEDDIDNTMKYEKLISAFEKQRPNFG